MTPSVIADSIVNLCGALGLCVAMFALHRRDPRSPLTQRLLLLLGVVAALFFIRGVGWWTGSVWLDRLSLDSGGIGAARRAHRHRRHFAASCAAHRQAIARWPAPSCSALAARSGWEPGRRLTRSLLSLFQLAGFATCAWLLATRDRSSCWRPKIAASAGLLPAR